MRYFPILMIKKALFSVYVPLWNNAIHKFSVPQSFKSLPYFIASRVWWQWWSLGALEIPHSATNQNCILASYQTSSFEPRFNCEKVNDIPGFSSMSSLVGFQDWKQVRIFRSLLCKRTPLRTKTWTFFLSCATFYSA